MKTILVGVIICCALINLTLTGTVGAVANWDVAVNEATSFHTSALCPTFVQYVAVRGFSDRQELCQFDGERMRAGTFFANGGEFRLAVSLPFDREFRAVEGVCQGFVGCLYSPEQDLLVVRYLVGQLQLGAKVFKRVSQRITLSPGGTTYVFDDSHPDYVLSSPSGIGALGLSRSGDWLAAEAKNSGVMLIDLKTLHTRQVMSTGVQYGLGKDPTMELAVSNDGRYVAVMGAGAGFGLVEVMPSCGTEDEVCPNVGGSVARFTTAFLFATHPFFNETGKQVSFYVASQGQGGRRVIMRQPGYVPARLSYLGMGDSFSSGEGETDDHHYKAGTNETDERCHLSDRAYPFLMGVYMDLSTASVQSVACAGARMLDVIGKNLPYFGQNQRLGSNRSSPLSDFGRSALQAEALEIFQPGRVYQASFVERYQPEVITLGIGGNDAGFMGKLKTCAMPDLCEWAGDPKARLGTGLEIQALFDRLRSLFRGLLERSGQSLIYAVGYPQIIEPEGICGPVTTTLLTYAERIFMKQGISYLNQVIKAAAENTGVFYLDTEHSLDGQQLCANPSLPKAVNGLRLGDDLALSQHLPMFKLIGNESFHPTFVGHELMAKRIREVYGDLRVRHGCDHCQTGDEPPPLPSYWGENIVVNDSVHQSYADLIDTEHISPSARKFNISLPAGSLEPHTKVRIEIHSEPRVVAEAVVGVDGNLTANIEIPLDLIEGYHSIHLYGMSYAHDQVDVYDIFSYGALPEIARVNSVELSSPDSTASIYDQSVLGVNEPQGLAIKTDQKGAQADKKTGFTLLVVAGAMTLTGGIIVGIRRIILQRRVNSSQDPGG